MKTRPGLAIVVSVVIAILVASGRSAGGADDAAPARAPERLSETGLYADAESRVIAPRNLPFQPQYPLWTDGAAKSRWIQLPPGAKIDATDTEHWVFPVGTRLWKEFAFDGRKIETRMLWRASATQWVFASYVWNEAQTEALLAPMGGVRNHFEMKPGAKYSIPAEIECRACHESGGTPVLGFNALQLSDDRDPLAPHAAAPAAAQLTLSSLDRAGLLAPQRRDLVENPPRIEARTPRERAVIGYLSTNCGSCHNGRGPLASLGLYLQHATTDSRDGRAPAIATAVGVSGEYVTPGADAASRRIAPGAPEASAILYRMSSRRPSSQMPPLGTAIVDRDAIELIRGWITHDLAELSRDLGSADERGERAAR